MAPKAVKDAPQHPPYQEMIKDAIVSLKERNGSSVAAIRKFFSSKYKLPNGWEKVLSYQLKKFAASGKLVKVKASYKLGDALRTEKKPASAQKKAVAKPVANKKASKPEAAKLVKQPKPKLVQTKAAKAGKVAKVAKKAPEKAGKVAKPSKKAPGKAKVAGITKKKPSAKKPAKKPVKKTVKKA